LTTLPILSTTDLGEAIREVGKLKQLRVLRVKNIRKDDVKTLFYNKGDATVGWRHYILKQVILCAK